MNPSKKHSFFRRSRGASLLVFGHRGAAGNAPENTLPSFERALADGADILETDLHLSRDGVPVCCHDAELSRTTGDAGRISELDFSALQRFDASFHWEGRRELDEAIPIPSLEEALHAFPDARFNIELKETHPAAAGRVLEVISATSCAERVLLTAGDDAIMARLRSAIASAGLPVAQGASSGDVLAFLRAARDGGEAPPAGPMALQVPPSFQGRPLVDEALLRYARRRGVEVHVWTINDVSEMLRLRKLGVDGIVTDHPQLAREVADR